MTISSVKLVFLDAGGVLFDTALRYKGRITHVLRARGFSDEQSERAISAAESVWQKFQASGGWLRTWAEEQEYWKRYYAALVNTLGETQESLVDELFHLCHFVNHCQLFPEVHLVLQHLQPRFRLAVISNAFPSMDWVFDQLDLRHYFEHIILSAGAGCAKPEERIYRYALGVTGCSPTETLFVDDQFGNVQAARAIGMKGLHLTRNGQGSEGDLHSLSELVEKLELE